MKTKLKYHKPRMKVFELKYPPQLLVGSNTGLRDYHWNTPEEE